MFSWIFFDESSWIFPVDSLVDFLTFAFALNTMFSFDKIREIVIKRITSGFKDVEADLLPIIHEAQVKLKKGIPPFSVISTLKTLGIKDFSVEIDQLKQKWQARLDCIERIFHMSFNMSALLSVAILVFSNCPYIVSYYRFSVLLLMPCLSFLLLSQTCKWLLSHDIKSLKLAIANCAQEAQKYGMLCDLILDKKTNCLESSNASCHIRL